MANIRKLSEGDLAEIAALEARSFADPWSADAVKMLTEPNAFGIVAETETGIVAYGGMICVLDEGQITDIATLPEHRRQGHAEAVLSAMLTEARARRLAFVTLEVRESNTPARGLYEKLGFCAVGARKNFYRKPTEDAVIMEKRF